MAMLLTGAGYIGAALLRRLDRSAAPVVVLDNFFSSSRDMVRAALPGGTQLVDGDVADPTAVARAFDVLKGKDVTLFHLAAQPSAAVAASQPELTERSNLIGARVLLEAARDRNARVVFGGSFRVYGDELVGQTVDEHSPYGRVGDLSHLSKIYVEQLARMIGASFVSVRLGVVYGLSPVMKTTPEFMTVPNLFCLRAAQGEPLRVLEDRPMAFIHVEDAARALLIAASQEPSGWDVFNAAPEVITIGQVARIVRSLAEARGASVRIEGVASSEAGFLTRSRLEFEPEHSMQTSLGEVLDYFFARR